MTSIPSTTVASAALSAGTISPRSFLPSAAAIAIDRAPLVGRVCRPWQLADNRVLGEQLGSGLPAADERAQGDRQIERCSVLRQVGRGQVTVGKYNPASTNAAI